MTEKIVVAIHGIGDQFAYATIQSVAYQFCKYYDVPAAIPLGRFQSKLVGAQGAFLVESPPDPAIPGEIGFAEVYWANVPRVPVREGFILEQATVWAKTVVGRLRLRTDPRCGASTTDENGKPIAPLDYAMAERVLLELSEAITVLGRLLFVAEKAGVFRFDLGKLLDDYLNDVQVVVEFEPYRKKVLDEFTTVMEAIQSTHRGAEVYIVGHSEGSVVAFLALLTAMAASETPAWVKQVRGLMTIGSPIDKHLVLWPELFSGVTKPVWQPGSPAKEPRIKWRNYYDYGDPIGFKLDTARTWLEENKWTAFEFDGKRDDIGFGRYMFPGEAHVEYWRDENVFGHFIETVIDPPKPTAPKTFKRPRTKVGPLFVSYALPYTLFGILLCLAAYLLYKAVNTYLVHDPEALVILRDTLGIASVLAGLTVVSRIPRLASHWRWRLIAVGLFVLSLFGYGWAATPGLKEHLGAAAAIFVPPAVSSAPLYVLASVVALAAMVIGILRPSWGVKTLLVPASAVVLGIVAYDIAVSSPAGGDSGPIWPVVLAGAAFVYLWWLACLLFDLTFVWHRYIRHEAARVELKAPIKNAIKRDAAYERAKHATG